MPLSGRWEFWKSPKDQPAWARPALLGIAAVATLLYARNIANAGFEGFYSVAVKSMSVSWKAFLYGAFDPNSTITLDKLAGSFVPQAISARIFGFHAWSLALPQVIEGVVSVLVMYRVVRRWMGPEAGLLAAGIFALTPVCVSMFGHSMEDGLLTMCLVLAADSCQRAMLEGRLRSLLWAAFWVGVGFQAKMMQAWIVLPAPAAGYLYSAPLPFARRLRDAGIAGAACLAVSLSWIALYELTPAHDRPYIDGSTNNSAISMVFGYNGLERFGVSFPGSVASMFGGGGNRHGQQLTGPVAGVMRDFQHGGFGMRSGGGWLKLAGSEFGPQIGWLFPLAFLALACGLLWSRRPSASSTDSAAASGSIAQSTRSSSSDVNHVIDPARGHVIGPGNLVGPFVLWGVWLVTFGFVFSAMKVIPHTAYVASLAPALAALSGAGIVLFCREYAAGTRRGWLLPVAVAAELGWSAWLWRSYRDFLPMARWAIVAGGIAVIAILVIAKLPGRTPALVTIGALAGAAAMVAAPAAWAGSALQARYDGTEMNAIAGPAPSGGGFGHVPPAAARMLGMGGHHRGGFAGWGATSTTLTAGQRVIYDYVTAHRDGAEYLMAAQSWSQAAPYIIATGKEVLPIGGFSGSVPSPTLSHLRHLIAAGKLRFFLVGQAGGQGFLGRARGRQSLAITSWVQRECAPTATTSLYECSAHAGGGGGQGTRVAGRHAPRSTGNTPVPGESATPRSPLPGRA
jgi:4-amino-4-deoxy-L-arabinose transferase-like glycosyltransferase